MSKCAQCNSDLPGNASFCIRCGTATGSGGGGAARKTTGDDGMFGGGGRGPVEIRQVSPGAARKTQLAEDDGFGDSTKPSVMVQSPPAFGTAAAGPRKTHLDEGGGFGVSPGAPPPLPAGLGAASAGRHTVLDEGGGLGSGPAAPAGSRASGPTADASRPRIVGWMISYDHNATGQEYALRAGKTSVGSGRDNNVSLFFDRKVSERHATLLWRDGKCAVKDETSSNGTFVNGEDVGIGETCSLKNGDTVRFGNSTFLVFLVDNALAAQLWPTAFGKPAR